ncbi:HD domain-containing protein [Enterococcus sp. BWM-S5]|uniref:HD domain-containing protein n=1 Tax=Enterococcus larvae TaxID=2794352 RepID=A0ABS4CGG3_9ENTE|nr:HD domain-containing protein [Enterococcus larvae]MBP1045706.1 HD domain-containing protein [Enterococcus larvae]
MDHVKRVVQLAEEIAAHETCSLFVVKAGAYLHDVIDDKLVVNEEEACQKAAIFLRDIGVTSGITKEILHVMTNVSYSKEVLQGRNRLLTIEAEIVQDADRLDALGAMGIIRTAYYGGKKGHKIHDPQKPVQRFETKEAYREGSTVINHFYEKLLKLQEGLHTEHARKLGKKKHDFLLLFLEQFLEEWG